MLEFLRHAIERYGYVAVTLIVTMEGFGIPFPGETAVVTAAAFAAGGALSVTGVALSATLGAVLGGSGGYWIGRLGGRRLLVRHGHWIGLDAKRLAHTEKYFVEHGVKTVFFARFVALLRIFGALFAGVAHMPFPTFTLVNVAGGALWAVSFSALGYVFGRNLPMLEERLGNVSLVISGIVVLAIVFWWVRNRRRSGTESSGSITE